MRYTVLFLALVAAACGPKPTTAIGATQRDLPFFRVLVYEKVTREGDAVSILIMEDEAGNCWITSGVDGGVVAAPASTCEAAKPKAPTPTGTDVETPSGRASDVAVGEPTMTVTYEPNLFMPGGIKPDGLTAALQLTQSGYVYAYCVNLPKAAK